MPILTSISINLSAACYFVPAWSWSDTVLQLDWLFAASQCLPLLWKSLPSYVEHQGQFLAPFRSTPPSATGYWLEPWGPAISARTYITLYYHLIVNTNECELRVDNEIVKRTVMLSKSLAMCLMMSLCWEGWVWSSFLITTTLSATTVSAKTCAVQTQSDWTWAANIYSPKRWFLPSLLESSSTRPLRQVSVTSAMLVAHLPMAWMVAAANALSWLFT